eukprot:3974708-Pleurochrysis_carterae.AAC.1
MSVRATEVIRCLPSHVSNARSGRVAACSKAGHYACCACVTKVSLQQWYYKARCPCVTRAGLRVILRARWRVGARDIISAKPIAVYEIRYMHLLVMRCVQRSTLFGPHH